MLPRRSASGLERQTPRGLSDWLELFQTVSRMPADQQWMYWKQILSTLAETGLSSHGLNVFARTLLHQRGIVLLGFIALIAAWSVDTGLDAAYSRFWHQTRRCLGRALRLRA